MKSLMCEVDNHAIQMVKINKRYVIVVIFLPKGRCENVCYCIPYLVQETHLKEKVLRYSEI